MHRKKTQVSKNTNPKLHPTPNTFGMRHPDASLRTCSVHKIPSREKTLNERPKKPIRPSTQARFTRILIMTHNALVNTTTTTTICTYVHAYASY